MNEVQVAENVLRTALSIAQRQGAGPVRVINLALYDECLDCQELAFPLNILARDTIAADAILNLNQRKFWLHKPTLAGQRGRAYFIESIELE